MTKLLLSVVATIAFAITLTAPASAAQPGLPFLAPLTEKTEVQYRYCKRYCSYYGYCGYGYNKYRCCKKWVCH